MSEERRVIITDNLDDAIELAAKDYHEHAEAAEALNRLRDRQYELIMTWNYDLACLITAANDYNNEVPSELEEIVDHLFKNYIREEFIPAFDKAIREKSYEPFEQFKDGDDYIFAPAEGVLFFDTAFEYGLQTTEEFDTVKQMKIALHNALASFLTARKNGTLPEFPIMLAFEGDI